MSEHVETYAVGNDNLAPVMTVKDWLIMFLISMIPLVGIVMVFVWAFGANENPNKKNYARASLIFTAIFLVLYIILLVMFFGAIMASLGSM